MAAITGFLQRYLTLLLCLFITVQATAVPEIAELIYDEATAAELEIRQSPGSCPPKGAIHLLVAPGRGAPNEANGGTGGLSTLIAKITGKYKGTSVRVVAYDFNSAIPATGRVTMRNYVNQYVVACPNTPIALLGYSVGGIICMDELCGASENIGPNTNPATPARLNNIFAMVSYGEESFRANQPYNAGTCMKDAPTYPRQNPAGCQAFYGIMRSYCDGVDPECCSGGVDPFSHSKYPAEYDNDAFNFVNQKYIQFMLTHPFKFFG